GRRTCRSSAGCRRVRTPGTARRARRRTAEPSRRRRRPTRRRRRTSPRQLTIRGRYVESSDVTPTEACDRAKIPQRSARCQGRVMYRSVLVGVFAGLLILAGAGMPAFAARAAGPADLSMTVGQFKQSSLTMQVRAGQSTGIISSVNLVSGVLAQADFPPIIVDVSQASHDLTIDNSNGVCTQTGTFTIRCRTDINPNLLFSVEAAA